MAKKVVLVIAHENYQPIEYGVPKKMLEQEGFQVITASNKKGEAQSTDDSTTIADIALEDLHIPDYDALIFIGGSGALEQLDNNTSYSKIQEAVMTGKLVGAICSATRILAKAGALVTKNATGWNKDGKLPEIYNQHAAIYNDLPVVTDGLIITAVGPQDAEEFARAIMKVI